MKQMTLFDLPELDPVVTVIYYDNPYSESGYKVRNRFVTWVEYVVLSQANKWIQYGMIKNYTIII